MNRRSFLCTTGPVLLGLATPLAAAEPSRSAWQIGCYTRPWDQHDYRVAFDGIAEAGFKYAGLMTAKCPTWVLITAATPVEEAARLGKELRQRGLAAISLYGGDFGAEKSVAEGIKGLTSLIDNCVACGSPNLLLGGTTKEEVFGPYYETVRECCRYAASKHVRLSIKPHGGQNATGPQCRKVIEKVGHDAFRLTYDPGNIFYYSDAKLDPVEDAATVDGLVAGMCVKDFLPPKEVMVTPGTGKVDFSRVLKRLAQGGFRGGPLVVEGLTRGDGLDAASITKEARKARKFLEELLPNLGL